MTAPDTPVRAGLIARILGRAPARPGRSEAASPGRLVLHLGDFKTGSTAIQSWLNRHGAAAGIATPPGFNQAALAHSLTTPPEACDAAFAALAQDLAPYLAQHPTKDADGTGARHIVISAEHFEMSPPDVLATMLDRHLPDLARDARLIAYVRPHPAAFLARFAESVKIGSHMGDLASYLDRPDIPRRLAYGSRLGAWADVFGARLTVRLFDLAAFPGRDVRRDFLRFVTGRDPGALPVAEDANPTPGLIALSRARALHQAIGPLPQAARNAQFTLGRAWGRLIAEPGDTPLQLDRALALRLRDAFGAEAAAADARFLPGAPLTRALDSAAATAPLTVPALDPARQLQPAALAEIARTGALLRTGFARDGAADMIDRIWHE